MKLVRARRMRKPERSRRTLTRVEPRPSVEVAPKRAVTPKREVYPLEGEEPETVALERYGAAPRAFSPPAAMGNHLRIQAASGHRAGFIELRRGLYLVVEVPAEAMTPEFGLAPLLAPLVVKAAVKAIENPEHVRQNMQTLTQVFRRPRSARPILPWADEEDLDEVYEGEFAGCRCGCNRCERGASR